MILFLGGENEERLVDDKGPLLYFPLVFVGGKYGSVAMGGILWAAVNQSER